MTTEADKQRLEQALEAVKVADRNYSNGCHITNLAGVYYEKREQARENLAKVLKAQR